MFERWNCFFLSKNFNIGGFPYQPKVAGKRKGRKV